MTKQSENKLAHRRLQMLEFAETLGNIRSAYRFLINYIPKVTPSSKTNG